MSDASLFSGLYQQIHEYAELLDDVLVNLKENTSSLEDKSRQELASFLLDHWPFATTKSISQRLLT